MFAVYASSAGSGKTFTLVLEYLKIVLAEPGAFRQILAITFTNKAANEMKERVLRALEGLAGGGRHEDPAIRKTLLPLLVGETGMTEPEIIRNAGMAYRMILHDYADFAVGTIDSFSHRLIRTFAFDFGLPVNFNVELDADEMLSAAVELLLERVGEEEPLTEILVDFLENRMEEDRGWRISELLTSFAHLLLAEDARERTARLRDIPLAGFRQVAGGLFRRIREFETRVQEAAREGVGLLRSGSFGPADLYQGERGVWKYFHDLAAGRTDRLDPNSYVTAAFDEDKWFSGKAAAGVREEISAIMPALTEIYRRIGVMIAAGRRDYFLRRLLAKTIYPLAVLNEIEKMLTGFRQRNNIVHISEFNARIAGIVMNEPVPFIYERLGEKYRNILIDEFQDTSVLQWMNFIPLIENSLAGGNFNLVVGDGKQAIYRWRGGEVEQFSVLPAIPGSDDNEIIKERESALRRSYRRVNLDRNFRSAGEIVAFNNRFFRIVADTVLTGGREKIYAGLEQVPHPDKPGGLVTIEFLAADGGVGYSDATLEQTYQLASDARAAGFGWRDIAILCRSNRNATEVARFLLGRGMEVVSAESLLLTNSPRVRFLIACLRRLYEPDHDIVRAEIAEYLGKQDRDPGLGVELPRSPYELLPLYDLCEALIRDYALNTEPDPYLQFFLDVLHRFTVKIAPGAPEFLKWWEDNNQKLSITVPEELDAVRVMTIHKAKGLEFPVVILPFAHETRKNTREYLWVDLEEDLAPGLPAAILRTDSDMEETVYREMLAEEKQKSMLDLVNLLYVAMTRAGERLHILTRQPPKKEEEVRSMPGFFYHFLKTVGRWDPEQTRYTFGVSRPNPVSGSVKPVRETLRAGRMQSVNWRDRIHIRLRAAQAWDLDNPAGKTAWGNRIHTLLSWLNSGNDVPRVLGKAMGAGLLDLAERDHAEKILLSVVSHPDLKSCFSEHAQVKSEAEILLPGGAFFRPDRVVFDGSRVVVIEYKSGLPRPEHAAQLNQYAGCLREMGHATIATRLVYLEPEVRVVIGE